MGVSRMFFGLHAWARRPCHLSRLPPPSPIHPRRRSKADDACPHGPRQRHGDGAFYRRKIRPIGDGSREENSGLRCDCIDLEGSPRVERYGVDADVGRPSVVAIFIEQHFANRCLRVATFSHDLVRYDGHVARIGGGWEKAGGGTNERRAGDEGTGHETPSTTMACAAYVRGGGLLFSSTVREQPHETLPAARRIGQASDKTVRTCRARER